jgi:hypothetical protein
MKTKIWIANALIVSLYASTIDAAGLNDVDLSLIDPQGPTSNKYSLYDENGNKLEEGINVLFERISKLAAKKKLKAKKKKKKLTTKKKKKKLKAKKKKKSKH